MSYLEKLQSKWNSYGNDDPLYFILTSDEKRYNWEKDEFFQTGIDEIDSVMDYIKSLNINISHNSALDFGCGVGRLTQALRQHFNEVSGVDISPSMIKLAIKYNKYGDSCKYFLNDIDDLRLFKDGSFDLIYSNKVLQHIKPDYTKKYIREFIRLLSLDGVLIFQLPGETTNLHYKISYGLQHFYPYHYLYSKIISKPSLDMYLIKKENVIKFLNENHADIIDIAKNDSAGPAFTSYRYCVTKK